MTVQPAPSGSSLQRLPLVTLYLTERCNSRCVTCDYWRHGRIDVDLQGIQRLLPSLARLRTEVVLISGGEPLLHPQWADIARLLKSQGLKLWLLTSGLSLAKHARTASALFDSITVSLDGTTPQTYAAIRGLDAFDPVCAGIRLAAAAGTPVSIRVTLQRANYRELPEFVSLAARLGASQVSFLAVDVSNPHAFARQDDFRADAALQATDLAEFERLIEDLVREQAPRFASGFIAESPAKLYRILRYFQAVCAAGPFPPTRCNAPEFSAVISADGRVQPCFFISGPRHVRAGTDLAAALDDPDMRALRRDIGAGKRTECERCVCTMWRDTESLTTYGLLTLPGVTQEASIGGSAQAALR